MKLSAYFGFWFGLVRGVTVPSSQVYPNNTNGTCGDDGFVWFWGYDGTTPGPTVYVPTNKRHERWGNDGDNGYPFDQPSTRSFDGLYPDNDDPPQYVQKHRSFESKSSDKRDHTPITIIRHWNRLGIDPHVTFDDLKAAAGLGNTSSLISG
jgi:hypothetical protein